VRRSPYREPGSVTDAAAPERVQPATGADDFAVAVVLFLVGVIGVGIGVAADRGMELILGLVMIALASRSWPRPG
jgi:hypothetical protein